MKKRIVSIVLVLCLITMHVSFPVEAGRNVKTEIIELLRLVEPQKEIYGLKNVEFSLIKVGNAISVYDYVDGTFEFSRNAYPLYI